MWAEKTRKKVAAGEQQLLGMQVGGLWSHRCPSTGSKHSILARTNHTSISLQFSLSLSVFDTPVDVPGAQFVPNASGPLQRANHRKLPTLII